MSDELVLNSLRSKFYGNHLDFIGGLEFSPFAIFLVLQDLLKGTQGLFPSNISMNGGSGPWYMRLTQFETVFLCFVMFKICVLRYIEILPININNWFHGDPSGRKRRSLPFSPDFKVDAVTESLTRLLRKMDEQECFLRSICFMASEEVNNKGSLLKIPSEISKLVAVLKKSSEYVPTFSNFTAALHGNPLETLIPFKTALSIGESDSRGAGKNTCEAHYKDCFLTRDDSIHYLNLIFQFLQEY